MARKRYTAAEIIGHLRRIEIENGEGPRERGEGLSQARRHEEADVRPYDSNDSWRPLAGYSHPQVGGHGKLLSPDRICPGRSPFE